MNYKNVKITIRSCNGGVEGIAEIELGILHIEDEVNLNCHTRNMQRTDFDSPRGSLSRFDVVESITIVTSRFLKSIYLKWDL